MSINQYKANVVCDSISSEGDRLTTIECTFPRFILPEVLTHRMLSKSAQSSRAIPVARRIDEVRENPFVPEYWGKTQRGMVAEQEISEDQRVDAISVWLEAAQAAADYATILAETKVHKQLVNRLLEPFSWQTNVMSSTDFGWENLLRLRDHPDAQPEFRILAQKIRSALDKSWPEALNVGEWHLPYISENEKLNHDLMSLQRASVARVARTSYGNQGGFDIAKDLELESRLFEADPKHDAPYEMVATPSPESTMGNYTGWSQLRHDSSWLKLRSSL